MKTLSMAMGALLLSGCVTPQTLTPSGHTIDFKKYKTVKLVIVDDVNTPYSKDGVPLFEGLLKGKLQSLGYSIVDKEEDLAIQVRITNFDPGNRAMRTLIGFGAGRALLTYLASFKDKTGAVVTEMTGGKSYHGVELSDNPLLYSDEKIEMGLVQESVIQIGHFIQNRGKLE